MVFRKAKVDGKISDVYNLDELHQYPAEMTESNVGVSVDTADGVNYVLPYKPTVNIQPGMTVKPGVYPLGNVGELIFYPQGEDSEYHPEVVDFGNVDSMVEFAAKQDRLKDIEKEILTDADNIFRPPVGDNDTPEMKALKLAIAQKHIDIDKYASRFGENYPNDKRKMKDDKISLMLLKRCGEALDMNIQIRISDKNPNVPNPMGNPIVINITSDGDEENSEE